MKGQRSRVCGKLFLLSDLPIGGWGMGCPQGPKHKQVWFFCKHMSEDKQVKSTTAASGYSAFFTLTAKKMISGSIGTLWVVIEFTIKSPSKFDIRWFKVCWFRICNKKYTKPCLFLREKCYKKYIFLLKNTQFAIEMNGEQPSNSTFWLSSSKTNSLTTPDFYICSSLYWILQNTKRKK